MRIADASKRTVILGRTGSGKTVAGVWHLSLRNWREMPWVILDYKGDSLIGKLPAKPITDWQVPKEPGLYVLRPMAKVDDDLVEYFLWQMKEQGNCGLYVDEGYMLPYDGKSDALNAILTQGRSLRVPTIILSQRPVWLSRFVITEADFFQVFWLNDSRDRVTLEAVIPAGVRERLPEYCSYYYDVGKDDLLKLEPVPMEEEILASFWQGIAKPEKSKKKLFFFGS